MPHNFLTQADALFQSRQYDAARTVYEQTLTQSSDPSDRAEALAMIARTFLITDRKEQGRPFLEQARPLASPDLPLAWSRYLSVRGRFEWKDNLLEPAAQTFKDMYAFCHDHRLHDRAIDAIHMIALLVPLDQQVEWARRGIAEAQTGAPRWLGPLWNNLAATYEELHQYPEALDAYQQARTFHYQYGNDSNKAKADWALAHAHRLLNQFDQALLLITPLLEKFQSQNDPEFLGWTHHELAQIHLAQHHSDEALTHLTLAQTHLFAANLPQWDPVTAQKIQSQLHQLQQQSPQQ